MGQYYRPVIETENGRVAIGTYLDGEYECAKLMEQSWFSVPFVLAVASLIYNKKAKIAWVGDYADNSVDEFPNIPVQEIYEDVWESEVIMKELKSSDFTLENKFFVNHDLKEYLDLNKYYKENTDKDGYCTNPVSLLTAIGNGLGGGDFDGDKEQVENVGKWAWDTLEITDEPPKKYKEVMYHFIEE